MYRWTAGALLLAIAAVPGVEAGKPTKPSSGNVATSNTGATVPSAVVEKQVARLTDEVHWCTTLEEAKALAQKENKPIFWLHALGDLDGIC